MFALDTNPSSTLWCKKIMYCAIFSLAGRPFTKHSAICNYCNYLKTLRTCVWLADTRKPLSRLMSKNANIAKLAEKIVSHQSWMQHVASPPCDPYLQVVTGGACLHCSIAHWCSQVWLVIIRSPWENYTTIKTAACAAIVLHWTFKFFI